MKRFQRGAEDVECCESRAPLEHGSSGGVALARSLGSCHTNGAVASPVRHTFIDYFSCVSIMTNGVLDKVGRVEPA